MNSEVFSRYLNYAKGIIITIIVFLVIKYILNSIKKRIIASTEKRKGRGWQKKLTLIKLFFSFSDYLLIFLFIWYLLKVFNVDTTPLLAITSVGGIAVGFAGQTFFKDSISGVFILLEDYFSVGDFVEIGDVSGTVEEIGIRTTKIRNYEGKLFLIPNGEIRSVIKYDVGDQFVVVELPISYESDIDRAKEVILKIGDKLIEEGVILDKPKILGVNELGDSSIVIKVLSKVDKGMRWSARRRFLEEAKKTFDKEGIEIPYNRMVVYVKSENEKQ